jgi:hypothetical protein
MNKFDKLHNILVNSQFRYLYLAGLISSDNLMENKDNYKYSMDSLNYIKDNISKMDKLTESEKAEILEFVDKGLDILNTEYNYYNG